MGNCRSRSTCGLAGHQLRTSEDAHDGLWISDFESVALGVASERAIVVLAPDHEPFAVCCIAQVGAADGKDFRPTGSTACNSKLVRKEARYDRLLFLHISRL